MGQIVFPPALGALGVTLLAFGLRLYRLADKNVWWDEGWTLWLSRLDLVQIALRTANDEHPPLHYWLMHFWLAGSPQNAQSIAPIVCVQNFYNIANRADATPASAERAQGHGVSTASAVSGRAVGVALGVAVLAVSLWGATHLKPRRSQFAS